ncbi:uncharacterized protein JCM10292_001186 [Rhodotorula paludigena]|uniref:uncharacterized protein n=1 Tax=Rhodotorula paludigena TaxID=86838 RepID=UPI00317CEA0F
MASPAPSTFVDARPPALAANAPTYPPLGAHFPSVAHFKLACYRVCLLDGTDPAEHVGNAAYAQILCPHAAPRQGRCSFRLAANNQRARFPGARDVWVTSSAGEHSCDAGKRRDGAEAARAEVRRRIGRMEELVRDQSKVQEEREAERRKVREREDEHRRAERDEEGRAAAKKARKGIRESLAGLGGASRRSRREEEEEEDGEDEAEDSEDERVSDDEDALSGVELFPPKAHVKSRVDKLIKAGKVTFPASSESFDSAAALFVRLYAYAQHSGFGLYRGSDHTQKTSARLVCSRSHARYSSQPGGCCSASVKIVQEADGLWRVTVARLQHNHPLDPVNPPAPGGRREKRRMEHDSPAGPDTGGLGPSVTPVESVLLAQDPASAPAHLWPATLFPPSTPPSVHVSAFLRATLPSDLSLSDYDYFASFLAQLGIESVKDLVGLVSMCDTALAALDEMATVAFGAREWSMGQLVALVLKAE